MKALRNLAAIGLSIFAFSAVAQTDKATTKKIINDKSYTFVATNAIPMNVSEVGNVLSKIPGSTSTNINLNGSNYDVRVTPDSIVVYLPYYGRAYTAPINRDDSGFKFTSKKFTYNSTDTKKGWAITINPKDNKEGVRMNLNVSENGYGSLTVGSNNKQSITYNGYLAENKPKN